MFNNSNSILEKYRKKRKEKVSISGVSIEFDWTILVIFTLLATLGVFYWAVITMDRIKHFVPESQEEDAFLIEDSQINRKIDKVLNELQN